jgi:hypothetical protein
MNQQLPQSLSGSLSTESKVQGQIGLFCHLAHLHPCLASLWLQGQLTLSARMNPLALSPAKALRRAHTPANSNKNEQDTSGSSSTAALHELQATGAGQQEQSINNTDVRSNPWHVLWATTPPCPAWEQKPLQVCVAEDAIGPGKGVALFVQAGSM